VSILQRDLVYDPDVLALQDDRIGLLARVLYWHALAGSNVTASDGTLPYDLATVRVRLFPAIQVQDEEVVEVRRRLNENGLVVPYEVGPRLYGLIPKWWSYNVRPDKARRGTKNPPVPAEVLARFPDFRATYVALSPGRGAFRETAVVSGNGRSYPGTDGHSGSESDSASGAGSDPDPDSGTASGSASDTWLEDSTAAADYVTDECRRRGRLPPLILADDSEALEDLYEDGGDQVKSGLAAEIHRHLDRTPGFPSIAMLCMDYRSRHGVS
jgi:hypothetical protein